jgi:carboxyl-terminal processing protease
MPARNVIFLIVAAVGCLAVWAGRDRELPGRRFNEVLTLIESAHLEPVDGDELFNAAVAGAVSRLDEHSAYLRGADRDDFESRLDQRFGGVGLELCLDDRGALVVAAPLVGGPAWVAGIRAGDHILGIDGESTRSLLLDAPLSAAVARLRGRPGEPVTLRVEQTGVEQAGGEQVEVAATLDPGVPLPRTVRDVPLIREVVRIESVLGDRRRGDGTWDFFLEGEPGVALIRITSFGEQTVAELDAALATLVAESPAALVIDLRGNTGGLFGAAVDTCDRFLDDGLISATRRRLDLGGPPQDMRQATPGSVLGGVPIAVLVDGLTASSAEVVAACLQDRGRARVFGSRTYGKGTVQAVLPLGAGDGLLKLTTAEYLRPSGGRIHRAESAGDDAEWGVRPDAGCEVAPTGAAVDQLRAWRRQRDLPGGVGESSMSVAMRHLPREVDDVLAAAVEATLTLVRDSSAAAADFGGEKEAAGDADDAPPAGE